jgi:hypothetical protein
MLKTGGSPMAIPEDRQKAAIDEAAATITQTRAAVQQAAQRLAQAKATLDAMPVTYGAYITAAQGTHNQAVWDGLTAAFVGLQTPVNAAVARAEVTALRNLEV